jgi:tetratricopeptide (TPR) repeat protein
MPRFRRWPRLLMLALSSLLLLAPARAHAAAPLPAPPRVAPAVALPDTGLFAPVARIYRARLARLDAIASAPLGPERVLLLLATGQPDRAHGLFDGVVDPGRALRVAAGRVELVRQDFTTLRNLLGTLSARGGLLPRERALDYAWRFACDDEASVDSLTRASLAGAPDAGTVADLLAAGRVAYDMLDYPRAESLFTRALATAPAPTAPPAWGDSTSARRALALTGIALVKQKRRDWDGSLATLREALEADGSPDVLMALTETLIRLGRTDESISAAEWAVRLAPYHDAAHYLLGNGYARKNYTQLFAAYPVAFADPAGRRAMGRADSLLGTGARDAARAAYSGIIGAHPGWADARVRLASLDFEDGRFAEARDGCFAALAACPEYGRAHAVLAKALEAQRFTVDVHRAGYEARFAAMPTPVVPGIERFVANWRALSPRHQKRVALSMAPWKAFVPVLVDGGATYFIKPMYMLLSEGPAMRTLRDQRINYDSRLWDDVRGCGGYHTVTGIEDVERTIFDRYNTVLHEFTHQVHAVLPADDSRTIQEHYTQAKQRDDATKNGYLSRYAAGSVFEYFAEGANALYSPMRDAHDPREVVRERLDRIDPALRTMVEGFMARTDVSASYPIAWAAGGDDRIENGRVPEALPLYRKALARDSTNETVLVSLSRALVLNGQAGEAVTTADRAVAAHPASGQARVARCDAGWHTAAGTTASRTQLALGRALVRTEDRYLVDLELGHLAWVDGDATQSLSAFDSVLAYQSDNPEGQQGRAAALALAGRSEEAFRQYEDAVRMRTGIPDLRCAYARDLLHTGRVAEARAQLEAARLLDERNPTAEALRAWADLVDGKLTSARSHARQAIAWGSWCDLARIVQGGIEQRTGNAAAANAAWAPVEQRLARKEPPSWVYRPGLATWEQVHVLPAVERQLLESFKGAPH